MPRTSPSSPEASDSPENPPTTVEIADLSVQLQYRDVPTTSAKAGKKPPAGKLQTKNKESSFTLEPTEANYYAFLLAILTVHDLNKYVPVTKKTKFGIKFSYGTQRTKKAALDIEKCSEFISCVEKMLNAGNHLSRATVYMNRDDVKAAHAKGQHSHGSDDDSDDGSLAKAIDSDEDDTATDHKTLLERELGRFRGLLEKKHANPHDAGYTYIHKNGEKLPLTPAMMSEWARALYDGTAKVDEPPTTLAFDPRKRERSLFERPSGAVAVRGGGETVLQTISSIMQDARAVFASLSSNPATGNHTAAPTTPVSKTCRDPNTAQGTAGAPDPLSPMCYDPSMIPIFLEHAKDKLGVSDALNYQYSLVDNSYGPDILPDIANDDLIKCGITPGDAIRLKRGASKWWNSSEAKRACNSMWRDPDEDKNMLRVEKRYTGEPGGSASLYCCGLKPGINHRAAEYTWWFFDDIQDKLVPVPDGLIPFFA